MDSPTPDTPLDTASPAAAPSRADLLALVGTIARIVAAPGRNPHAQLGSIRLRLEHAGLAGEPSTERRRADD